MPTSPTTRGSPMLLPGRAWGPQGRQARQAQACLIFFLIAAALALAYHHLVMQDDADDDGGGNDANADAAAGSHANGGQGASGSKIVSKRLAALAAASPMALEVLVERERFLPTRFVDSGIYMAFDLRSIASKILVGPDLEASLTTLGMSASGKQLILRATTPQPGTSATPPPPEREADFVDVARGVSSLYDTADFSVFFPLLQKSAYRRLAMQQRRYRTIDASYMKGIGKEGRIAIPRRLGPNVELLAAICDVTGPFTNGTLSCSPNAMQLIRTLADALKHLNAKGGGGDGIGSHHIRQADATKFLTSAAKCDIVAERARIAQNGYAQTSLSLLFNGNHPFLSPVGAGQFLCGALPPANAKHMGMLQAYDAALLGLHGDELTEIIDQHLTPLDPSSRAEELLLTKIRVWDPLRKAQLSSSSSSSSASASTMPAQEAARLLMRPTVLCAILTYEGREGLELALMQRALWGRQCDEHVIFVASTSAARANGGKSHGKAAANASTKSNTFAFSEQRRAAADIAASPQGIVYVKIPDDVQKKKPDGSFYPNMWQLFREVVASLEMSTRTSSFSYVYFGFEDNYVIPQNIYLMLMQKDIYTLNGLSTPLFLGHRMVAGQQKGSEPNTNGKKGKKKTGADEDEDTQLAYASSGPGFLLNSVALSILQSVQMLEGCFPNNASNAVDLLLASCLDLAGIPVRDTSDLAGQDRMHVLSVHWLLQAARFASNGAAPAAAGDGAIDSNGSSATVAAAAPSDRLPPGGAAADSQPKKQTTFAASASAGAGRGWWYVEQHQRTLQGHRENPFRTLSTTSFSFNKVNTPSKALWLHLQLFPHPPLKEE